MINIDTSDEHIPISGLFLQPPASSNTSSLCPALSDNDTGRWIHDNSVGRTDTNSADMEKKNIYL